VFTYTQLIQSVGRATRKGVHTGVKDLIGLPVYMYVLQSKRINVKIGGEHVLDILQQKANIHDDIEFLFEMATKQYEEKTLQ